MTDAEYFIVGKPRKFNDHVTIKEYSNDQFDFTACFGFLQKKKIVGL